MKKILFCGGVMIVASSMAWATVTPCDTDTLADYIADYGSGDGCSIGDKVFSNFQYDLTGGTAPAAADINAIPVMPSANVEGFTFHGVWSVSGTSQNLDSLIGFTVMSTSGATIEDASFITLSGAGVTGSGQLAITEGLCLGSFPCPGGTAALFASGTGPGAIVLQDHTTFTPTGALDASKDIHLTTGATTGSVELTSITDVFSQVQVPEPASIALLGSTLLGLGLLARRKRAA